MKAASHLNLPCSYMPKWPITVTELYPSDPAVREAILCVAYGKLGRQFNDRNFVLSSMQHYGKALVAVNKALQDPDKRVSDHVLASCKLLSVFEVRTPFFFPESLPFYG